MTDLASRVARVERLLARAIVAANSSEPVETHLGLACEFIGAREDFLSLLADRARMEKALREAEEVLAMAALMPMVDPVHGDEVEALGLRIGFGALMSSAQASWRQQADVKGGEFVAGPCFATVIETLKTIRQALGASQ